MLKNSASCARRSAIHAALGVSTRFADYGLDDPDVAIRAVLDSPRGRNFIGADL